MKTFVRTCGNCLGLGVEYTFEIGEDPQGGTVYRTDTICPVCNGQGHTEYAAFTIDEAKAILKYCGLSEENNKEKNV